MQQGILVKFQVFLEANSKDFSARLKTMNMIAEAQETGDWSKVFAAGAIEGVDFHEANRRKPKSSIPAAPQATAAPRQDEPTPVNEPVEEPTDEATTDPDADVTPADPDADAPPHARRGRSAA
jgi:hypothetical protein